MTFNFSAKDRVKHVHFGFGDVLDVLSKNTVRVQFHGFYDIKDVHPDNLTLTCPAPPEFSVIKTPNNSDEPFLYKKGDRVKLKFNQSTGTVVRDQMGSEGAIFVKWDKSGKCIWEEPKSLVVLHAPRHTDEPHPNQELIDQIEAVRLPLKAEVERQQALLKHLTSALKIAKQVN